jgi:4-amino-4-deoxy-L-arabinose transferase-like glycosyltransferase
MAAILPFIAFSLAYGLVLEGGRGRRFSFLLASVVWGSLVTLFTEVTSLAGAFTFRPVVALWAVTCAGLALAIALRRRPVRTGVRHLRRWPRPARALLAGVVGIVGVVWIVAIVSPSNSHDGLTYHMARVVHWIQNETVAPYPTSNPRQTAFGPWAEYAIAQFQLLSGSDRLANCIAWFAMVGTAAGASLLAEYLGGGRRTQLFAAVFCATLPSGILQGATSLNDGVVTLWIVCFVCLALRPRTDRESWWRAATLGSSAGLALLTKPSAAFFLAPFVAWVVARWLAQARAHALAPLAAAAVVAIAFALPHYARNLEVYGSPSGPEAYVGSQLRMETHSPSVLYSNLVRNLALHFALPSTRFNQYVTERVVVALHFVVGLDPNDPRTTTSRNSFEILPRMHEAIVGNLLHLVFAAWILWIVANDVRRRVRAVTEPLVVHVACIVVGFVLFCLFVKWNPYLARIHLPSFVLMAPVGGIVLERVVRARTVYKWAAVLLLSSLPWVFLSRNRPIASRWNIFNTPREYQLFYDYSGGIPSWQRAWLGVLERVKKGECRDVGLLAADAEMLEYQVWALLDAGDDPKFRFEHVTSPEEPAYGSPVVPGFVPCVVVGFHARGAETITVAGRSYVRTFTSPEWSLYEPASP